MESNLKKIRKRQGLTQAALARKLNVSESQISRLEKQNRQLTQSWIERLSVALDCSKMELLGESEISREDLRILSYIQSLSPAQKAATMEWLEAFTNKNSSGNEKAG
jgi:transcriptional regulator with XRE-family HTH domain